MSTVHVIASRYGGAVLAVVPAESVDQVEHRAWLDHIAHQAGHGHPHHAVSSHELDADAVPPLEHGHAVRDGEITATGHVAAQAALATASAANALIARQQAIIEKLAARLDALEGKVSHGPDA